MLFNRAAEQQRVGLLVGARVPEGDRWEACKLGDEACRVVVRKAAGGCAGAVG